MRLKWGLAIDQRTFSRFETVPVATGAPTSHCQLRIFTKIYPIDETESRGGVAPAAGLGIITAECAGALGPTAWRWVWKDAGTCQGRQPQTSAAHLSQTARSRLIIIGLKENP